MDHVTSEFDAHFPYFAPLEVHHDHGFGVDFSSPTPSSDLQSLFDSFSDNDESAEDPWPIRSLAGSPPCHETNWTSSPGVIGYAANGRRMASGQQAEEMLWEKALTNARALIKALMFSFRSTAFRSAKLAVVKAVSNIEVINKYMEAALNADDREQMFAVRKEYRNVSKGLRLRYIASVDLLLPIAATLRFDERQFENSRQLFVRLGDCLIIFMRHLAAIAQTSLTYGQADKMSLYLSSGFAAFENIAQHIDNEMFVGSMRELVRANYMYLHQLEGHRERNELATRTQHRFSQLNLLLYRTLGAFYARYDINERDAFVEKVQEISRFATNEIERNHLLLNVIKHRLNMPDPIPTAVLFQRFSQLIGGGGAHSERENNPAPSPSTCSDSMSTVDSDAYVDDDCDASNSRAPSSLYEGYSLQSARFVMPPVSASAPNFNMPPPPLLKPKPMTHASRHRMPTTQRMCRGSTENLSIPVRHENHSRRPSAHDSMWVYVDDNGTVYGEEERESRVQIGLRSPPPFPYGSDGSLSYASSSDGLDETLRPIHLSDDYSAPPPNLLDQATMDELTLAKVLRANMMLQNLAHGLGVLPFSGGVPPTHSHFSLCS